MGGPRYVLNKIFNRNKNKASKNDFSSGCKFVTGREKFFNGGYQFRKDIVILATGHVEFIANLLREKLNNLGFETSILNSMPEGGYSDSLHIVLCPQMFPVLPEVYFAFQLEQRESKWFTADYMKILHGSVAVFDYAIENIKYLIDNGFSYKQIFYLPITPSKIDNENKKEKYEYDVLFYGDTNSERRKTILGKIGEKFKLKICQGIYGSQLIEEIKKARVVINIHYYENAILETTRLAQLLSIGKIVVSEAGVNKEEQKHFENIVNFVDIGDIQGLISKISEVLNSYDAYSRRMTEISSAFASGIDKFEFYLYRALLAYDLITFDQFYYSIGKKVKISDFVCLSLIETTERQESFRKEHPEINVFQGLRHDTGWIGCGLSYKFMIKLAKDSGLKKIMICEDDVRFLNNHCENLEEVSKYLKEDDRWDIFSGLIADFDKNTKIYNVKELKAGYLATIDRMVSTVFNIYNNSVYDKILMWNPMYRNATNNTIDRYIQKTGGLRIECKYPFLVAQNDDANSTLWGFVNTQYSNMIKNSERAFLDKIRTYVGE